MSYGNTVKKPKDQVIRSSTLEFQVARDILFPKICIICGTDTENIYRRTIFGAYEATKDYKEDYIINLPICDDCTKNINIKTGFSSKSGKLILISSLMGLIISLIVYFLTFSIFLSISLFTLSVILPIIRYRTKTKKKVKLNDYLMIGLGKDKNSLIFDFLNEYYAKYINEINSKRDKSEETEEKAEKTINS